MYSPEYYISTTIGVHPIEYPLFTQAALTKSRWIKINRFAPLCAFRRDDDWGWILQNERFIFTSCWSWLLHCHIFFHFILCWKFEIICSIFFFLRFRRDYISFHIWHVKTQTNYIKLLAFDIKVKSEKSLSTVGWCGMLASR